MNYQELKELQELLQEQEAMVVVTVLEGNLSGETALIYGNRITGVSPGLAQLLNIDNCFEADNCLETELIKLGDFSLTSQQILVGEVTLVQGGVLNILLEPVLPEPKLLVLGAGHIAKPLTQLADIIQLPTIVYDDRPDLANAHAFPGAERVICDSFSKLSIYQLIKPNTLVVVVTRGHQQDYICLEQLLLQPIAYLGMVSSKRRAKQVKERLVEQGFAQKQVEEIRSPIGLDIGAATPGEIAVSIIGELVSMRQKKNASVGIEKQGCKTSGWRVTGVDREAQGVLRQVVGKVLSEGKPLALVTIIKTLGSTPRKTGAKMAVNALGELIGTIGGGCNEAQAKLVAIDVLKTGEPQLVKVSMTEQVAAEEGMMCGGTMEIFIQRIGV